MRRQHSSSVLPWRCLFFWLSANYCAGLLQRRRQRLAAVAVVAAASARASAASRWSRARCASPGAWRRPARWSRTTWCARFARSWTLTTVTTSSARSSCCSACTATPTRTRWCSGRWRCASCRDCRSTASASSASRARRSASRTSPPKLPMSSSCDHVRRHSLRSCCCWYIGDSWVRTRTYTMRTLWYIRTQTMPARGWWGLGLSPYLPHNQLCRRAQNTHTHADVNGSSGTLIVSSCTVAVDLAS